MSLAVLGGAFPDAASAADDTEAAGGVLAWGREVVAAVFVAGEGGVAETDEEVEAEADEINTGAFAGAFALEDEELAARGACVTLTAELTFPTEVCAGRALGEGAVAVGADEGVARGRTGGARPVLAMFVVDGPDFNGSVMFPTEAVFDAAACRGGGDAD